MGGPGVAGRALRPGAAAGTGLLRRVDGSGRRLRSRPAGHQGRPCHRFSPGGRCRVGHRSGPVLPLPSRGDDRRGAEPRRARPLRAGRRLCRWTRHAGDGRPRVPGRQVQGHGQRIPDSVDPGRDGGAVGGSRHGARVLRTCSPGPDRSRRFPTAADAARGFGGPAPVGTRGRLSGGPPRRYGHSGRLRARWPLSAAGRGRAVGRGPLRRHRPGGPARRSGRWLLADQRHPAAARHPARPRPRGPVPQGDGALPGRLVRGVRPAPGIDGCGGLRCRRRGRGRTAFRGSPGYRARPGRRLRPEAPRAQALAGGRALHR